MTGNSNLSAAADTTENMTCVRALRRRRCEHAVDGAGHPRGTVNPHSKQERENMSEPAPSGRARRSRSQRTPTKRAAPAATVRPPVSAEQRHTLIAESAYLRAAARGFAGGDPVADWLASEREVDALLSGGNG